MPKNKPYTESIRSIIDQIKKVMPSSSATPLSPKKEKALADLMTKLPEKLDRSADVHALLTDKNPNKHPKNFWRAFIHILAQKPGWRQPAILTRLSLKLSSTENTPARVVKQQNQLRKEIHALLGKKIIDACLAGLPLDAALKQAGENRAGNWVQSVFTYLVEGLNRDQKIFLDWLMDIAEYSDLFRVMNIEETAQMLSQQAWGTAASLLIAIAFNQANPPIRQIDTSSLSTDEQAHYAKLAKYYQQQRNIRLENAEKPITDALETLADGWAHASGNQLAVALLRQKDQLKARFFWLPDTTFKNLSFFAPNTKVGEKLCHTWNQLMLLNVLASDAFNLAPERKALLPAYQPARAAFTSLPLLDKQLLEAQKEIAMEEATFETMAASSSNGATSSTLLSQCSSSFDFRATPSNSDSTSTGSINLDSPPKLRP